MKLHLSKKRIITLCLILTSVVLLLVAYLAHGFIRESVIPAYARLFYGRRVNAEYNTGLDEVRRIAPFDQMKGADTAPLECKRYYAQMFHVTSECGRWTNQRLSFSFADESDFNKKMRDMEKSFADIGWHSSTGFHTTFRTPLGGDHWGYSMQYENKGDIDGCFLHVQTAQEGGQSLMVSYGCIRYVGFLGRAINSY
jgi:hypothetical protein